MSSYATNAAGVSKYTAERHQRILQELLQQPGNDVCADCKSRAPRWSSWNLGIFICVQCASIHRKIGTHITKVKSVNLDAWTKEQVESMKNMGNIASNAKWNPNESRHPPPTNMEESERDSEMEKYIRAKYETKKFLDRKPVTSSSPSSNAPVASTQPSTSNPIPRQPKPEVEETDPSQTVPLGFGRESRVEFNLSGMGLGGDIWDGIVQQKRVPPRSQTAPIPEPAPRATPPPVPAVPAPVPLSHLPSRSVSAQPPPPQLGVNTAVPTNGVWGDMLALQSAGSSLPASTVQASPLQTSNPYAALSASSSTSLPSTLMNRMGPTRSFTAPAPNPFFNQGHQQQPSTGSTNSLLSVPTGSSFGSVGLGAVPTGGSFGSIGSNGPGAGGVGTSPGGLNPFGTSPGVGSAFGTSSIGSFGGSMSVGGSFGAPTGGTFSPTGALGTTMMSPGQMTTQHSPFQQTTPSPFQQTQSSPFQQSTMSPFGVGAVNSLTSPNTNATSLSAFGAAMSPQGQASNSPYSQVSNSPFGQAAASPFTQASNSPYAQATSSPFGQTGTQFSGSNSPFQTMNPGFQSTPTNNALFLQPNNAPQFQPSTSPYQTSNPPFPQSNIPYQAANTNPFANMGANGGMNTNPFGQPQYQGQQGWGGM
ncbi:unnamed protein product [Rhizoctonia solani]|uniref:Arf-GAP domain-containing protein n=1 Tax=Rhizoctonia solani TaxID=456999 RepID=A0A8H3H4A3_9AGAM|nr:unnamed protein product [Rhizoctonia solani]